MYKEKYIRSRAHCILQKSASWSSNSLSNYYALKCYIGLLFNKDTVAIITTEIKMLMTWRRSRHSSRINPPPQQYRTFILMKTYWRRYSSNTSRWSSLHTIFMSIHPSKKKNIYIRYFNIFLFCNVVCCWSLISRVSLLSLEGKPVALLYNMKYFFFS